MKRRQLYMIELGPEPQRIDPQKNQDFIENFQTAILLSLLENKQLTKWQFDICVDELQKQSHKGQKSTNSCNKKLNKTMMGGV